MDTTHIICIIDRSGSMASLTNDTIGGYNTFIAKQKALPGDAVVTLVLFDDRYEVVYEARPLADVPLLTTDVYYTRGGTALRDAMGKAIGTAMRSPKAVVVMMTDGEDNQSHEYTREAIKALVTERTGAGWEFVFFGAGMDAIGASAALGVKSSNVMSAASSPIGVNAVYGAMDASVRSYRTGGSAAVVPQVDVTWTGDSVAPIATSTVEKK